jgi:hypothetical protein
LSDVQEAGTSYIVRQECRKETRVILTKTIPLTKGYEAMVDDEDYEKLSVHKWCVNVNRNAVYARLGSPRCKGKQDEIKMHTVIMNAPKGWQVDHIDGNGLNNQKENLRIVTNRQNCMNRHQNKTSRYPGVTWNKRSGVWNAQAQVFGKHKHLGTFRTEEDAYQAYLKVVHPLEESIKERLP